MMNMLEWKQQMYNVHMQQHILSWYAFLNPHRSDMKWVHENAVPCVASREQLLLSIVTVQLNRLSALNSIDCYISKLSYTLTHYIV